MMDWKRKTSSVLNGLAQRIVSVVIGLARRTASLVVVVCALRIRKVIHPLLREERSYVPDKDVRWRRN